MFTGSEILQSPYPVTTSYDPIWYLYHSDVQLHQFLWTDCNEFDQIALADLDNRPDAYFAYCEHGECIEPKKYPKEWRQFGLDDVMHFGGVLQEKEWSYINRSNLTVRQLFDASAWGIVYDLGNGQGFYEKSGMREFCKGKLNQTWFILNDDQRAKEQEMMNAVPTHMGTNTPYNQWIAAVIVILCVFGCFIFWRVPGIHNENKIVLNDTTVKYGAI